MSVNKILLLLVVVPVVVVVVVAWCHSLVYYYNCPCVGAQNLPLLGRSWSCCRELLKTRSTPSCTRRETRVSSAPENPASRLVSAFPAAFVQILRFCPCDTGESPWNILCHCAFSTHGPDMVWWLKGICLVRIMYLQSVNSSSLGSTWPDAEWPPENWLIKTKNQ